MRVCSADLTSTHAGVLCFSHKFRRDRTYFAAVETEIAQRAVIELAKCVVGIPLLPVLPVARERSAYDCTGCLDCGDDDLAEKARSARCRYASVLVCAHPADAGLAGRLIFAGSHQFRSITTSRYSAGTTNEAGPAVLHRLSSAVMSFASATCPAGSSAANALCVGP